SASKRGRNCGRAQGTVPLVFRSSDTGTRSAECPMSSPHLARPPAPRILMLFVAVWVTGCVRSPVEAQGKPLATLTSFGVLTDVRRSVGGSAIVPVQRGLGLHPGNVLQTDPSGRAEALLDDGTQMKVNVRTALELLPSRARPIRVLHGRVFLRARS